jgi:hypothetical protein
MTLDSSVMNVSIATVAKDVGTTVTGIQVQWPGGGIEFHPSHGEWIRVLRANGFVVEALHELYAPVDGATHGYYVIATAQWARQWPVEDLWAAHLGRESGGD